METLTQWKWMIAGGVVILAWVISNIKFESLVKLFI
jgi:hypothetical protein